MEPIDLLASGLGIYAMLAASAVCGAAIWASSGERVDMFRLLRYVGYGFVLAAATLLVVVRLSP